MTDRAGSDRMTAHRARKSAGYTHVSGYTRTEDATGIQGKLLTADDVDKAIEKEKK